jgi:hypothetical protein
MAPIRNTRILLLALCPKIGGHFIRYAGVTQDGCPYLIMAKPHSGEMFYVIAQCDAEGNGAGFLQMT